MNNLAYVSSNKIIVQNFGEQVQSQISNKGFSISTFACDYHRGLIVWGTIEEDPKLIFQKVSSNSILNTIKLESNYEYRHLVFSHFGDQLAVCSGYNLNSKAILTIVETETFFTNQQMRHELDEIPLQLHFNPIDSRTLQLIQEDRIELIIYESIFEKNSLNFDLDKFVKLVVTFPLEHKASSFQVDNLHNIWIAQDLEVILLKFNKNDKQLVKLAGQPIESKVTIISSTSEFLITFHENCTILFRNPQSEGSDTFKPALRYKLDNYQITKMCFEPNQTSIQCETSTGLLIKVLMSELDNVDENVDETEEQKDVIKDIQPETRVIHSFLRADCYDGLCCSIDGDSTFCAVASTTGQVKVQELITNQEHFSHREVGARFTTILAIKSMVLIGDEKGFLRIQDYKQNKLVDVFKFQDNKSIDFIVKDHENRNTLIVVSSKQSNKFWVCMLKDNVNTLLVVGQDYLIEKDVNGEDIGEVDEVGFVEMNPDSKVLMMCTNKLLLISIDIQKGVDMEEDPRTNIELNPMKQMKLQGKLFPEAQRIRINQESKRAHIQGQEERSRVWQKIWRLESLPISSECNLAELKQGDLKQSSKDISDVEVIMQNQLKDTNVQYLQDGSLKLWTNGRDKELPQEVDVINGGVKQLIITQSVFVILTQDNSFCSQKYTNNELIIDSEQFFKNDSASKTTVSDENTFKIDLVEKWLQNSYISQNKAKIIEMNNKHINGLAHIKDKMSLLLLENQRNPEIRQLERENFLINIKFREHLDADMVNAIKEIRAKSKMMNLRKEAERFLIQKQTKENMANDQRGMCGIRQDLTMYNYIVPKTSATFQKNLKKAKYKAMIDLRAKVWRKTHKRKAIDFKSFKQTGSENYIINIVPGENKTIEILMKLEEEKQPPKHEMTPKFEQIPFDTSYFNNIEMFKKSDLKPYQFLYEFFEVNTRQKKMNMVQLIQEQITFLKSIFNRKQHFINTSKMAAKENIQVQLKLMKDISEELDIPYEDQEIPTHTFENIETLFNVKESEVKVPRILTDEEIDKMEMQRKIQEEEERKKNQDDYLKRGSVEMMNDTLDTRKGLKNKKKGLDREEWMDGDPFEFNEDQKKQMAEFLEKCRLFEEDQKRIKEELLDTLKKSKMSVDSFIKEFDRKLNEMFTTKCSLDKIITSYEIYSMKLLMNIQNEENLTNKVEKIQQRIKLLEKQLSEMPDERDLLDSAHNTEREDKKTKEEKKDKDISQWEIKVLANAWWEETRDFYQKNPTSYQLDLNYLKALQVGDKNENNCFWRFEEIFYKDYIVSRKKRVEKKKKIRQDGKVVLEESRKSMKGEIHKNNLELNNIMMLDSKPEDLEIICLINTGKMEVDTQEDPRDQSMGKLLPKKNIIDLNLEITECGKKITSNLITRKKNEQKTRGYILKKETYQQKVDVFKALTEALQMLKVTKDLQNKLNFIDMPSENNGMNINQMIENKKRQALEMQMEKYDQQMSNKFKSQEDEVERLQSELEKQQQEHNRLENELHLIHTKLDRFNKIKLTEVEEGKDSSKRMKEVSRKRRMLDQMKAYQEEIDFLKEELDKLRAKTFPSFAHTKKVI